ncbi:MAG TPA: DUF308 domain-containing protein [Nocardioidaceae bacterium]|nr:DUF308 domain-containing protein [Nocardioidaceae bacterium]
MTEQNTAARPSQVTMAGWVALIGSVLLVLTLFDSVSKLRTVEFRDTIDEFLSTPPGNGLGLEISQVQEILRVLMFFSGAAAAAATVLAIYVLQRNNAARVGYTIAAVAIMLTAPVSGGFLPVMITFAAIMLWTKPARDWFAGIPAEQSASSDSRSPDPRRAHFFAHDPSRPRSEGNVLSSDNQPPHDQPEGFGPEDSNQRPDGEATPSWPRMPEEPSGQVPPPTQGYGTPASQQQPPAGQPGQGQQGQGQPGQGQPGQPGQAGPAYPQGGYPPPPPYGQRPPYPQQPPYGQPPQGAPQYAQQGSPYGYPQQYAQPYYGAPQGPVDPNRRPTTVTVAAWITWGLSALSILGFVLTGLVLGVARDEFINQLEQNPDFEQLDVPTDQVVAGLWVIGAIALFWGIAAIVLAWFAYRRANWARITLVVSSAMTVLFSILTFPVGLLHTLGAGAVVALLFMGGANEWYTGARSGGQAHPGPFQPYGQSPQGQQPYGGQQAQPPQGQPPQQGRPEEPPRDRGKDEPPSNVW